MRDESRHERIEFLLIAQLRVQGIVVTDVVAVSASGTRREVGRAVTLRDAQCVEVRHDVRKGSESKPGLELYTIRADGNPERPSVYTCLRFVHGVIDDSVGRKHGGDHAKSMLAWLDSHPESGMKSAFEASMGRRMSMRARQSLFVGIAVLVLLVTVTIGCGKTVGETIDDATITTRVKTALINAPDVGALSIDVDTFKGIVTLSGRVKSQDEATRAMGVARGIDGVRDVKSALQVIPGN
jgi:hyperosmotically inducible protein